MSAFSKNDPRKGTDAAPMTEKQRAELKEAKSLRAYTITFIVVMVLAVAIAVAAVVKTNFENSGYREQHTTALTVESHSFTAAELNYFYIDSISSAYNNWYNKYGNYMSYFLSMMNLDLTKSLSSQVYDTANNRTWADYFVDAAVANAKNTVALYDLAVAEKHTLTEDEQTTLDTKIKNLSVNANYNKYSSVNAYLKAMYGNGADESTYTKYLEMTALADSYYAAHYYALSYTDEEIRNYDSEHAKEFNNYSFAIYPLSANSFLQGGTTSEDGKTTTYSDEEKAASVIAAKEAADSLLKGTTQDLLDKYIKALDINKESTTAASTQVNDTLYSGFSGSYPTNVLDWITAEDRKEGDVTVLENATTTKDEDGEETTTINGYYVVLFKGMDPNTVKLSNVRHILAQYEGGTKDDSNNTVYSDEEKAAAKAEAEALLNEWKAGEATEDSFAALADEKTDDTGSKGVGGLYENIYPTAGYVETFRDWACADHQPGDTEIIESEFGYHVMYYVGDSELNYRDTMISNTLKSDAQNEWNTALAEAVKAELKDISLLSLDLIITPSTTSAS